MDIVKTLVENYFTEDKKENQYKIYFDNQVDMKEDLAQEFVDFCLDHLKIADETTDLKIVFSDDKDSFTTYAFYLPDNKVAAVYCPGRSILDIFRSLAHELVHFKQDIKGEITPEQTSESNDGVPIENEANAVAGIIMRKFGRLHKELY